MPECNNVLEWSVLSPYQRGEWDCFENITSRYFGKQYYFLESHKMVYSRMSCKTMTIAEAIQEFMNYLEDDNGKT